MGTSPIRFVSGVLFAIIYAGLRLLTSNGSSPAWAAHLRSLALLAAFLCLVLGDQTNFTLRSITGMYQRQAKTSFFVGLACLILIPIALWVLYTRYYGPLVGTLSATS